MSERLTQEQFERQVEMKYNGKFSVLGQYINWKTKVEIRCNSCGHRFFRIPNNITSSNKTIRCPVCESKSVGNEVVVGKTDLWSTDPEIAALLEDSSIGYKYKRSSEHTAWFVCQDCGHRHFDKIKNITKRGFKCKCCGGTSYYPNQFLYNLLDLLGISFDTEYYIATYPYRFDAHFFYGEHEYVVEMDGGFGHGCGDTKNRTMEQQVIDDAAKDKIARDNKMIMIRIDCKYTGCDDRYTYVSNSIKSSLLSELFVIQDDMYVEADKRANISQLKKLLILIKDGVRSYDEFCNRLHKKYCAVHNMIKRAHDLNLIDNYEIFCKEMKFETAKKKMISRGIPIICDQTGIVYPSLQEAVRKTGIQSLKNYFYSSMDHAGTLPDGTKLTWTKLEKAV